MQQAELAPSDGAKEAKVPEPEKVVIDLAPIIARLEQKQASRPKMDTGAFNLFQRGQESGVVVQHQTAIEYRRQGNTIVLADRQKRVNPHQFKKRIQDAD